MDKPTVKELAEIVGNSRKQRIELTDYCRDFCKKNNEMTMGVMEKMFAGISEEQLQVTIRTIIQMEDNLKNLN